MPHALQPHQAGWLSALDAYEHRYADESESIGWFRSFMTECAEAASRELLQRHLTASAWLVSADGQRVLLTHHRKLDRWLQLGGHADGDTDLARAALREAEEESGLRDLVVEPAIFDIDRHRIPARGNESEHWHYDVRHVARATAGEDYAVSDESHALAWRDIRELAVDASIGESVRRMARKWLARGGSAILPRTP
jgi:8-oxo-dGTP pyrophosphatase MutT (NUDIX family)